MRGPLTGIVLTALRFECALKAMLHGAIFLATCNAILLLRDVKLPNTSLHYTPPVNSIYIYIWNDNIQSFDCENSEASIPVFHADWTSVSVPQTSGLLGLDVSFIPPLQTVARPV
jgi:hypothetical protein